MWSSFQPSTFHHHCTMAAIHSMWLKTRSIHLATLLIEWAGMASAMQSAPIRMCRWIVKFNTDQCRVAATLVKWKNAESPQCPRCPHPLENTAMSFNVTGSMLTSPGREACGASPNLIAQTLTPKFFCYHHSEPQIVASRGHPPVLQLKPISIPSFP